MLYTENYQFRKPIIGVDIADVKDLNFNSDKLDALLHNTQISLAPAYDLLETYNTGDIVMYETLMYKCKEDNVTGAWDASKWERTTAGEEGSGGGGGSSVVPNPSGTPTDTLNTIEIDGTIFDIEGSGGGISDEVIFTDTTGTTGARNITLTKSLNNFDAVYFEWFGTSEEQYTASHVSPVYPIEANDNGNVSVVCYPTYGNRYIVLTGDPTSTSVSLQSGTWDTVPLSVYKIHGIKFKGGGSSSVIPNPQGSPTDTLETIEIDGTVFDIAGSGGGGGGSAYTETLLYENAGTSAENITLSDDLSNYDMLMFVVVRTIGVGRELIELPFMTSDLTIGTHITLISYASEYVNYDVTSMTLLTMTNSYSNYVEKVKGLKFGGGKAARIDLLWDYVNDNSGNIYWSGNALTLNGDIRNYDEVVVEIVSAQEDVSNQWKSSYQWRLLVDPLINSFEPGTFTICSYDQRSAKFQFTNTTLQKLLGNGSENGVIRVYGVTYGGESKASEIIQISAGDGTLSRTFTFDKTPKFIKFHWEDTVLYSGWILDFDIVWGQTYCANVTHRRNVDVANIAGGSVILAYSLDGKSVTITAANAFQACNTSNGTGSMFVDYGGVARAGGIPDTSDDMSDMTWTLLDSTTTTGTATAIPTGTKYLVVTAEFGNSEVAMIAKESLANINKLMDVSQLSKCILGGTWRDSAENNNICSAEISNNQVKAISSYNTVTAKVYAVS